MMNKEEKLRKMQLVEKFCEESNIDRGEIQFLFNELAYASRDYPFDIYYEDGEIAKHLDLRKQPVAVKLKMYDGSGRWLSLKTSYPFKATPKDAAVLVSGLPQVSKQPWRLPTKDEMEMLFSDCRHPSIFALVDQLRRFFCLPPFFEAEPDDTDGRFVVFGCTDNLGCQTFQGVYACFPNMFCKNTGEEVFWWPVCDTE